MNDLADRIIAITGVPRDAAEEWVVLAGELGLSGVTAERYIMQQIASGWRPSETRSFAAADTRPRGGWFDWLLARIGYAIRPLDELAPSGRRWRWQRAGAQR